MTDDGYILHVADVSSSRPESSVIGDHCLNLGDTAKDFAGVCAVHYCLVADYSQYSFCVLVGVRVKQNTGLRLDIVDLGLSASVETRNEKDTECENSNEPHVKPPMNYTAGSLSMFNRSYITDGASMPR